MAERDTTPDTDFERDAVALAKALDEFAEELSTVLEHYGAGRKALVQAMGVDQSDLSGWMQGHEQIHQIKSRRLPGTAEVDALINHTGLQEKNPPRREGCAKSLGRWRTWLPGFQNGIPAVGEASRALPEAQYSSPAEKKGQEEPANSGGSESSSPAKMLRPSPTAPGPLTVRRDRCGLFDCCSCLFSVFKGFVDVFFTVGSCTVLPISVTFSHRRAFPRLLFHPQRAQSPPPPADLPATVEETEEPREPREQLSVATKTAGRGRA